jgi:hypothetical protein
MITAMLCSETGHPDPPTDCDISVPAECSIRAHREGNKRPYLTFKPQWIAMSIADAKQLRDALIQALGPKRRKRR